LPGRTIKARKGKSGSQELKLRIRHVHAYADQVSPWFGWQATRQAQEAEEKIKETGVEAKKPVPGAAPASNAAPVVLAGAAATIAVILPTSTAQIDSSMKQGLERKECLHDGREG
jgi:hypothetical protein